MPNWSCSASGQFFVNLTSRNGCNRGITEFLNPFHIACFSKSSIFNVSNILTGGFAMPRTITFQPSEKMESFIEGLVTSGNYNNQSEVVRAGVRLLEEQTAASSLEEIRQLIKDGDDSPDVENFSMENIKKKLKATFQKLGA